MNRNRVEPHIRARVWVVFLVFLARPAQSSAPGQEFGSLPKDLGPEISRAMSKGNIPSATIALVHNDKIVWTGAYGYSNAWARTPASDETVYLIGSIFKTMSTFALLQQMEQGRFKLDDPVNDHLTEFKIRGDVPSNPVTFRHLLTHTSGLPADFGPCPVWSDRAPLPIRQYLEQSLRLQSPPLSTVIYSNVAYTLVAYLVEKLSGTPFRRYIQQNILNPLEMKDTAFEPRPEMVERLAIPYFFETKSARYLPVGWTKANVWPAGIIYGTVLDLANWLIANLNQGLYKGVRLISPETFQEVMRRQYDQFAGPMHEGWLNETTGYGLTWWVSERNGEKIFAHSGSVTGYTAFLAGNLDRKTGFAILTNGNRGHKYLFELAIIALDCMSREIEAAKLP